jgi:hypothetical protein
VYIREGYEDRHPATRQLLQWFASDHLPANLQEVASGIREAAYEVVDAVPDGPELSAGLRKLLEAKDCFVRARLESGR